MSQAKLVGKKQTYNVQKPLGKYTYVVTGNQKNKQYCLKLYNFNLFERSLKAFVNNRIQNQPKNRKLIKFYEWFKKNETVYLIQEYCGEESLDQIYQQQLSTFDIREIIFNVGYQLEALHKLGYAYCNLQASNIIIKKIQRENNNCTIQYKLCEFGQIKNLCTSEKQINRLSQNFQTAPNYYVHFSVDIRKFSQLIYQLFAKSTLPEDASNQTICERIRQNKRIGKDLKDLFLSIYEITSVDQVPQIAQTNKSLRDFFLHKIKLYERNLENQKLKKKTQSENQNHLPPLNCQVCSKFQNIQDNWIEYLQKHQNQKNWTQQNKNEAQKFLTLRKIYCEFRELLDQY